MTLRLTTLSCVAVASLSLSLACGDDDERGDHSDADASAGAASGGDGGASGGSGGTSGGSGGATAGSGGTSGGTGGSSGGTGGNGGTAGGTGGTGGDSGGAGGDPSDAGTPDGSSGDLDAAAPDSGAADGACAPQTFAVTNNATSDYVIDSQNDPTLVLCRGTTYTFTVNAPTHPFYIKTVSGVTGTGSQYTDGVTNAGTDNGTVTFVVPQAAPSTLYYQCGNHTGMTGQLTIL